MKNFVIGALTLLFTLSAQAICCKSGEPWNGHGNYSQDICVANGLQWVEGRSCRNETTDNLENKCPRGMQLVFQVTSAESMKRCSQSGGQIISTPTERLCCKRK